METLKKLLIFPEMEPCTLQPELEKINKIHLEKNSLYFVKWNFLALILKEFGKRIPGKKLLIFREMELSDSNIKKFLIFPQKKTFLIFG